MDFTHFDFTDFIHKSEHKDDKMIQGNIAYPNAKKLLRPQTLKGPWLILAAVVIALAACVAWNFLSTASDSIYFSQIRMRTQVEQNIARDISYDFVQLKSYITYSSAQDVYDEVSSEYTLVQLGVDEVSEDGFDAFKLPSDVSSEEGAAALKGGIGSMNKVQASKVLKGGWRITMDVSNYQDLRVRYTDFSSATLEDAILSAIYSQGFDGDDCEVTAEGIDESGNTYKSGTCDIDGETYFWRVSAVQFNDAYSIDGIPDTAIYVGVRMTN